jgi:DME family drug/metabolite transporter
MSRRRGAGLVVLAAVLWGSTGSAQELGAADASPLTVGAIRLAIGGLGLVLIAAATGGIRFPRQLPTAHVVAMILGIAVYQLSFFAAVRTAGVALGTVVAIGSAPVLTGALVWVMTGRHPGLRWLQATVLAFVGVVLIGSPTGVSLAGIGLATLAGASYATYAVAAERLVAVMPARGAMAVGFGGGAVLLSPLLFIDDLTWATTAAGSAAALWLGLAATAGAYLLFGRGLQLIPVAFAATLSLAEPATAFLLGIGLLGERPDTPAYVGCALVMAALAWIGLE